MRLPHSSVFVFNFLSTHDIPPFDIAPEYALELLMASNYLDT